MLFAFLNLHPDQILDSVVPSGGDMGAHVWGPAFLRDHLLTHGRLSGWTPDWYAGFPAYQFYMVVPSLLIVALDVGLFGGWLMIVPLAAGGGLVYVEHAPRRVAPLDRGRGGGASWSCSASSSRTAPRSSSSRCSGVLSLPVCAYAFGRLADLPFPGPALLSVASVLFLFDRNFTIYGGNVASTLAGEFAFSISLSLALLYLGVVIRGLRTGKHRALAAVLLALTGLCHLIPAFFALDRHVRDRGDATPAGAHLDLGRLRAPGGRADQRVLGAAVLVAARLRERHGLGEAALRHRGERLPVAARHAVHPRRRHVLEVPHPAVASAGCPTTCAGSSPSRASAWCSRSRSASGPACTWPGCTVLMAFGVRVPGRGPPLERPAPALLLPRPLPAGGHRGRRGRRAPSPCSSRRDPDRPSVIGPAVTAGVVALSAFVFVGPPAAVAARGQQRADGSYSWFLFDNGVNQQSFVRSWAKWNYTGYEGKAAYAEYRDLVNTMRDIGEEHGCGRSFWEYEKEINRYGTPMALMLLPHWTDGCIGSMEGLFFEASATTPFHFLTQVELSAAPSAAQRDLPYGSFDIDAGVRHLQLMGVRYYLATIGAGHHRRAGPPRPHRAGDLGPLGDLRGGEQRPRGAARERAGGARRPEPDPARLDLRAPGTRTTSARAPPSPGTSTRTPRASSSPRPVPTSGSGSTRRTPIRRCARCPSAEVSGVEVGTDRIAFDVDRVGTPVLVKASYFPNWQVDGADGPYRVAPNLMVVVPTDEHVELTYGRQPVEWIGYALTLLGIGLAIFLATRPPLRGRDPEIEPPDGDDPRRRRDVGPASAGSTGDPAELAEPPPARHFAPRP